MENPSEDEVRFLGLGRDSPVDGEGPITVNILHHLLEGTTH